MTTQRDRGAVTTTPSSLTHHVDNNNIIKAIIFDLDGTLLDTEVLSDLAIIMSLRPYFAATHSRTAASVVKNHNDDDDNNNNYNDDDSMKMGVIERRFEERMVVRENTPSPAAAAAAAAPNTATIPWELKRRLLGKRGAEWCPIVISYVQEKCLCDVTAATTTATASNGRKRSDRPTIELPSVQQLWSDWEANLGALCENVAACPGAAELVNALVTKNNGSDSNSRKLKLAVATSSRHAGVVKKRKLHEDTIFQFMDEIVCGDDPAVRQGKPAPDIFLEAARRLGVEPGHCLVFEDALSGVQVSVFRSFRVFPLRRGLLWIVVTNPSLSFSLLCILCVFGLRDRDGRVLTPPLFFLVISGSESGRLPCDCRPGSTIFH